MLKKPYRHIIRPFADGKYVTRIDNSYVADPQYSNVRMQSVTAYHSLENDLKELFLYISPDERNFSSFSAKTYEILFRACSELEQNFKAILVANGYKKDSPKYKFSIYDYRRVEKSSRLSEYVIKLNYWHPSPVYLHPYEDWVKSDPPLEFYAAYNATKHNRATESHRANFNMAIEAVGALYILLFSQYYTFALNPYQMQYSYWVEANFVTAEDRLFSIRVPNSWSDAEKYDFAWPETINPFEPYDQFDFESA